MVSQILMLALSLLIAAQQPNVPENLKIQATNTALYAISVAQNELKTTPTPVAASFATEATSTQKQAVSGQKTGNVRTGLDGCEYSLPLSGRGPAIKTWCPKK